MDRKRREWIGPAIVGLLVFGVVVVLHSVRVAGTIAPAPMENAMQGGARGDAGVGLKESVTEPRQEIRTQPAPLRRIPARSSDAREVIVELEDNALTISVRPFRLPSIARPVRLADIYAELKDLAQKGDASAAFGLYEWLSECGIVPADQAGLAKSIVRLHQERLMPGPNGELQRTSDPVRAEGTLRRISAFCEGIPEEARAEASSWLTVASASGELFALKAQTRELRRSPPELAAAYRELWEKHGYTGALSPLAAFYARGIGVERDYVRAYAYQFVELQLVKSVYGESGFPSHRNMLIAMEEGLSNTGSYLAPADQQRAAELGVLLLRNNKNCCVGILFGTTY